MPGIEELEARLAQLSDDYYGEKRAGIEDAFLKKYESQFNGDRGLGLAILEELENRGVDTSAADEAIQQILDQLRSSVAQMAASLGLLQRQMSEKMDELNKVSDAVDSAIANNPNSTLDLSGMPPMDMPPEPPVDQGPAPMDMPPAEPPVDQGPAPMDMPPAEQEPAPMDMPPAEQEPMPAEPAPMDMPPAPPVGTLSDERMKRIKGAVSNSVKAKVARNSFKPSAGMLEAAQRGY